MHGRIKLLSLEGKEFKILNRKLETIVISFSYSLGTGEYARE